jgi:hypothetical protein
MIWVRQIQQWRMGQLLLGKYRKATRVKQRDQKNVFYIYFTASDRKRIRMRILDWPEYVYRYSLKRKSTSLQYLFTLVDFKPNTKECSNTTQK